MKNVTVDAKCNGIVAGTTYPASVNGPLQISGQLNVSFGAGQKWFGYGSTANYCSPVITATGSVTLKGTGSWLATDRLNLPNDIYNAGTLSIEGLNLYAPTTMDLTGSGTLNLTNVHTPGQTGVTTTYPMFGNITGQTINMNGADLTIAGRYVNTTINLAPGTSNYIGIKGKYPPSNLKIRGIGVSTYLTLEGVVHASWNYDPATGILTIGPGPSEAGNVSNVMIDIGTGYDISKFLIVSAPGAAGAASIAYVGPAPCFLADTMIATPDGARPVQDLVAGDLIVTLEGGHRVARPIMRMVSQQQIVSPTLPDDLAGYAVCVARNALADNQPCKDMYLTSEHCLHLDGGLVPVRMLVNGQSVRYDRERLEYTYYHIDMGEHYIILADGVEVESYLPNLDELRISGADSLNYARVLVTPAAPLRVEQDFVEPLHRRIAARAGIKAVAAKPRKASNLRVMTADGRVHQPMSTAQGVAHFKLPAGTQHVTLISETMRPCDLYGAFVDDRRALGTLIGAVSLRDAQGEIALTTHLEGGALAGWHDAFAAGYRWTNGYAALALPARQAQGRDMVLSIHFMDEPQMQDNGFLEASRRRA
ncbi:Hint domain-containing protein [Asaia bogorensis]|uniref:Hint domain-containing protein n=1 Tax=Asaia bogorensis TaxID=91915 RepID=UPI00286B004A|nr:Hint domain-containing protein [Asaia bogorensis]